MLLLSKRLTRDVDQSARPRLQEKLPLEEIRHSVLDALALDRGVMRGSHAGDALHQLRRLRDSEPPEAAHTIALVCVFLNERRRGPSAGLRKRQRQIVADLDVVVVHASRLSKDPADFVENRPIITVGNGPDRRGSTQGAPERIRRAAQHGKVAGPVISMAACEYETRRMVGWDVVNADGAGTFRHCAAFGHWGSDI